MRIFSNFKAIAIFFISCFLVGCSSDETNLDENNGNSETYSIDLGVGQSAKDLLTADPFSNLIIEVGYM